MKYSLIFAATAAAYEAYPAQSSSTPIGYTTVVPGYGKEPVTVTKQHQPYPTCVSAGYGDKSCDKWAEELYVSTVIKDYDSKDCTITKTKQPVTVYHTKKTITHSATGKYDGYASPTGGYAAPTGLPAKNGTGCWYELYEKIETSEYKDLGPHALPGYPGSGLYKDSEKKQKVHVKEYKGGKWSEYEHVHEYGTPEPEITSYPKPGVYTIPAKDVTVEYTVTKGGEVYEPGVYHHDAKTITVTKSNEPYTCHFKQTKKYEPTATGKKDYPAHPTATGAYDDSYGYNKPSATPKKPTDDEETYPQYPAKGNGTHGLYPTATPVYIYSKPSYDDSEEGYGKPTKPTATSKAEYPSYPEETPSHGDKHYNGEDYPATPAKASSTPCSDKVKPTPSVVKPSEYNNYPAEPTPVKPTAGKPEYDAYPAEPTPVKPSVVKPEYDSYPAEPTPVKPTAGKPEYDAYPAEPTPVKPSVVKPEYDAYPAAPTAKGGYKRASFAERRRV